MTDESPTLQFLGGAGTVTGSKYLITFHNKQFLMECGLFQGVKSLRLRNWERPPFESQKLAAVILSHAHIDHSGYLPRVVREGFRGPVYCSHGTRDLLHVLLPDAGRIQEEDAEYANRKGYSRHHPAEPLFSERDAERALKLLEGKRYQKPFDVIKGCRATLRPAGHIFGSATIQLDFDTDPAVRLVFSGDLGRWGRPITADPQLVPRADVLMVESTYGNRHHPLDRVDDELTDVVARIVKRKGVLIIPAFAVGRTQEILWRLDRLEQQNRIPPIPVFIDSPMATDVTEIYCRHPEEHDLQMQNRMDGGECPLMRTDYVFTQSREQSKALNERDGPMIIIAGSGMATGGRVLHHLRQRLPDPRTIVLLAGYQAKGTRGRALLDGATSLKMHGRNIPVRAEVAVLDGLSAHADQGDIDRWLDGFESPPRRVFLVHGEPDSAQALAQHLRTQRQWDVQVAKDRQVIKL